MGATADVVNQALQLVGNNQVLVTGDAPNFDNSPSGIAAAKLYGPCVATVARQFEWDMARNTVALQLSGNVAPFPWSLEYLYPGNGIQVWQLAPPSLVDPNNPLPTTWVVANAIVGAAQRKVIQTDLVAALAIYNNNPGPEVWDAGFREAVVRLLASEFSTALAGRPDTANIMLQSGAGFEKVGESRRD